ncbi:hypothetical protein BX600DRAFT_454549 [Xylariales sp. PMI_506]|nr:hypothetical protein BX600DRAFT_454549 [Xylariales sp. PMI_506]
MRINLQQYNKKFTTMSTESISTASCATATPYRQIRAQYDEETVTVYQAYNQEIASQAVAFQKLNASPLFRPNRMTWVKPSWCWMMYRAGYSYKDRNQERILALKMKKEDFFRLLEKATLATSGHGAQITKKTPGMASTRDAAAEAGPETAKSAAVKVQWDPERSPRLERLEYRSIQIGIPVALQTEWIESQIASIEDVTERARGLKKILEQEPQISDHDLLERGYIPEERELDVSGKLQKILEMEY